MKAIQRLVGLGLCLAGVSLASAQPPKCSAVVTKVSVSPDPENEKTWIVLFNAAVSGCERSSGSFDYVAEVEGRGRTELLTVHETFDAPKSGNNNFTVSFHAPPGKELKNVKSATVKSCTCT